MKLLLLLITPTLGLLRNYIKYKQTNVYMFIRTPFIYGCLYILCQTRNIWKLMMYERWFFFIYKSFLSLYHNDYMKNKEKYKLKYNLQYQEHTIPT